MGSTFLVKCTGKLEVTQVFSPQLPFFRILLSALTTRIMIEATKRAEKWLFNIICFHAFLLLVLTKIAAAGTTVSYLPGFDGELPFKLQTGYIGVGEWNESQLFYYFVESQRNPEMDPLMLWLAGGPGCSTLFAILYEQGPLVFDYANFNGSLPILHLNPYAWTQANVIYLDQPVGTGFSYSTTQENYHVDDTKSAAQTYEFLRKWLLEHPQYLTNKLFIGGNSYAGIPLPIVVQHIVNGNEAGLEPLMNLKGYTLGSPCTDHFIDFNSRLPAAYRLSLISEELYEYAKLHCGGDYVNVNSSNTECASAINEYKELVLQIEKDNILDPICQTASLGTNEARRQLEHEPEGANSCKEYNYVLSEVWANDRRVQEALHVRENTKGVWERCNSSLAYTKTVRSSVEFHRNLSKKSLQVLIYSGDHELIFTHIGTHNWVRTLNLTKDENWRAWFVDGQVAGFTEKYINGDYTLIFATVKGAGHVPTEYKPNECLALMDRFFGYYPL
ncbi:hypothetical protein SLEP1_g13132 [Rubroshorea leprosula]|uniref:Serine carboxypeptidase-like 18 n=1 Tax=Rubroshorea leprosula TaxID=152421 RepID=A0AAV5IKU5_9ROSI|nr:hypothetical protein SLEP1_g13132 [Rubroshorea leprosula]